MLLPAHRVLVSTSTYQLCLNSTTTRLFRPTGCLLSLVVGIPNSNSCPTSSWPVYYSQLLADEELFEFMNMDSQDNVVCIVLIHKTIIPLNDDECVSPGRR